jgi:two-component system sensor histidine kinase DesK
VHVDGGAWRGAGGLASRTLVLAVLGCSLVARTTDANPHPSAAYVPFVVALFVLPFWYATGRGRHIWSRYAGVLLAVQAVLTYVPFAVFGHTWVGGVSGLLGALVLLLLPARVRWAAFGGLALLELALWLAVGLPYEPDRRAAFWVLTAFVNVSLSGFALNRLADLLDTLAATRQRLVTEAVTRQRLAAAAHLQERIVERLAELSEDAGAVVRTADPAQVRTGLVATGRLARTAAADARRLLIELPDPALVALPAATDAAMVAPRLARRVTAVVVMLFAGQFLVNMGVLGDEFRPSWGKVVAACVVAAVVVVLTLRHLELRDPPDRPRGWPWTLALSGALAMSFYPTADGSGTLVLLTLVAASGLVLVRHHVRWLFLVGVVVALPVLTLARPSADLLSRQQQLLWGVYAGATGAAACLLVYGLSRFTRTSLAVQAAQREAAGAAATQEQLRLAHDAHDALGLGLSTIALKSDLALALLDSDPERARHETVQIMHLAAIVSRDASAVGTGSLALDLDSELASARSTLGAAGVALRVAATPPDIPAETGAVLAAVLREAVTNILRHSAALTCGIDLRQGAAGLTLEVTNDGVTGARTSDAGLGLRSMSERLRPLGGSLRTRREDDVHTLTVEIPAVLPAVALPVPG